MKAISDRNRTITNRNKPVMKPSTTFTVLYYLPRVVFVILLAVIVGGAIGWLVK